MSLLKIKVHLLFFVEKYKKMIKELVHNYKPHPQSFSGLYLEVLDNCFPIG